MATNIRFKRGISSNFNSITLTPGEPAFVTDTGKLYLGDGIKNVLINPIDKPISLDLNNYYSKVKVNDYGQVIAQTSLAASDIPTLPTSKISGLGTAATANTGTTSGTVPVLDANGRLPDSTMPLSVVGTFCMASYSGITGTTVAADQYVPLGIFFTNSNNYSLDTNTGLVSISQAGVYLISYNISSATSTLNTSLSPGTTNNWIGSLAKSSSSLVTPFTSTSATIVKSVTVLPEKYGIKNIGSTAISLINGYATLSIIKIA